MLVTTSLILATSLAATPSFSFETGPEVQSVQNELRLN